ncbi:hypothetical protein M758_10G106400 [Ceratodon purpureus]|nr:hypothetical protein M758_10G106400 [Ceratodon purpureus]
MGAVQGKPERGGSSRPVERTVEVEQERTQSDVETQHSSKLPHGSGRTTRSSRNNTAIHQDYQPCKQWYPTQMSSRPDPNRVIDIVFLHGLQVGDGKHARESAWTNSDKVCWPRDWLPSKLEQSRQGYTVRVLGIEYNAQATGHRSGLFGVRANGHKRVANGLFQSLVNSKSCSLGKKPFVLVGHSYGGIVIKSLVVICNDLARTKRDPSRLSPGEIRAIDAASAFMNNLKGYVFYGVPQRGSNLANYANWTNKFVPLCLGGSVCNDLVPFKQEILDLTTKFEAAIKGRDIMQFAFGETKKTGTFVKCMVVDHSSAQGNLDNTEFMELQGTNHRTVCKPKSEEGEGFTKFVELMEDIIRREVEVIDRVQAVPLTAPNASSPGVQVPVPSKWPRWPRWRKSAESTTRKLFAYGSCRRDDDLLPLMTYDKTISSSKFTHDSRKEK